MTDMLSRIRYVDLALEKEDALFCSQVQHEASLLFE